MATRKASAVWEGGLKGGKGSLKTESGVLNAQYGFGSRFENGPGTNPEELLGASYAACYAMALSAALERAGTPATKVEADAATTVEKLEAGFKVTKIQLTVRAVVPGVAAEAFAQQAEQTRSGCIIAQTMKGNVELILDAKLQ